MEESKRERVKDKVEGDEERKKKGEESKKKRGEEGEEGGESRGI